MVSRVHVSFFCPHPISGATSSKDTQDILYARQKIIVTAKAFGLQAIDLVYIDFRDGEGLLRQSREGAAMGFTGTILADILESSSEMSKHSRATYLIDLFHYLKCGNVIEGKNLLNKLCFPLVVQLKQCSLRFISSLH